MGRRDFYDDPNAPEPNSLVPAASAIVVDDDGRILLHRRQDNEMWALPGGKMELGESLADCARREVKEETGFDVDIVGLVGTYTDPKHVFEYDDGEVRQEFSICMLARIVGGTRGERRVVRGGLPPSRGDRRPSDGGLHQAEDHRLPERGYASAPVSTTPASAIRRSVSSRARSNSGRPMRIARETSGRSHSDPESRQSVPQGRRARRRAGGQVAVGERLVQVPNSRKETRRPGRVSREVSLRSAHLSGGPPAEPDARTRGPHKSGAIQRMKPDIASSGEYPMSCTRAAATNNSRSPSNALPTAAASAAARRTCCWRRPRFVMC